MADKCRMKRVIKLKFWAEPFPRHRVTNSIAVESVTQCLETVEAANYQLWMGLYVWIFHAVHVVIQWNLL